MPKNATFSPDWVSPPGDTIDAILEERGLTRDELAKAIQWGHSSAGNS